MLLLEDELEAIFEIANIAIDPVVVFSHCRLGEERLLSLDLDCPGDVGIDVEVMHVLQRLLKTQDFVVCVGENVARHFTADGRRLMSYWCGCQVEHLTKQEVDAVEVIWRDQVAAVVGVDVDGDDGHASTSHVVKEGGCCREWISP